MMDIPYFNPVLKKKPIRLKGKAKTQLKIDIYNRANESCENKDCRRWQPLSIDGKFCEYTCLNLHHVKKRSQGGDDSMENCVLLCFECHRKEHP